MLKIRLQGTLRDIQWFRRILEKHKELDVLEVSDAYSYIVSGINKFVFYCQRHGYEKICESIIMKHYENISSKEATEEDYLVENLDWEE